MTDSTEMSTEMSALHQEMDRLLNPEIDQSLVRINASFLERHPEKTAYILSQMFEFGYRSGMEATGQFIRKLERRMASQ